MATHAPQGTARTREVVARTGWCENVTICAVPGATVTTADLWSTGVGNDCGVPEAIPGRRSGATRARLPPGGDQHQRRPGSPRRQRRGGERDVGTGRDVQRRLPPATGPARRQRRLQDRSERRQLPQCRSQRVLPPRGGQRLLQHRPVRPVPADECPQRRPRVLRPPAVGRVRARHGRVAAGRRQHRGWVARQGLAGPG